jgi:hypothetical protein
MAIPNGGLITETNRQYYAGAQQKYIAAAGVGQTIASTFDTDLTFGSSDPANNDYLLNNFDILTSPNALTWTSLTPSSPIANTTIIAPLNNPVAPTPAGPQVTLTILVPNTSVVAGMIIKTGLITYGTVTTVTSPTIFKR